MIENFEGVSTPFRILTKEIMAQVIKAAAMYCDRKFAIIKTMIDHSQRDAVGFASGQCNGQRTGVTDSGKSSWSKETIIFP